MTNKEKEIVRCLIGKVADIPPDDIKILLSSGHDFTLYVLNNYIGHNLVLGFDSMPDLLKVREDIKNLYLAGVELDWEEEHPI